MVHVQGAHRDDTMEVCCPIAAMDASSMYKLEERVVGGYVQNIIVLQFSFDRMTEYLSILINVI